MKKKVLLALVIFIIFFCCLVLFLFNRNNKVVQRILLEENKNVKLPYININSADAEKINEQIEILKLKLIDDGDYANYRKYKNKNILSVVIEGKNDNYQLVRTYNFDLKTKNLITIENLFDYEDYSNYSVDDITKYIESKFRDRYKDLVTNFDHAHTVIKYDISKFYLDKNGILNIYVDDVIAPNYSINFKITDIVPKTNTNKDETQTQLEWIINNELYLLGGKKNLADLTNREKITLGYEFSGGFGITTLPNETFDADLLRKSFEESSLGNLNINMEDIYHPSYGKMYNYDKENDRFVDTGAGHKGRFFVDYYYVKISDYEKEDNKYKISAQFVWTWNHMSSLDFLYGKFEDASKQINPIYEVPEWKKVFTIDEINDIMDKNNVETYNFVFEKKDNKFKLIDFDVK